MKLSNRSEDPAFGYHVTASTLPRARRRSVAVLAVHNVLLSQKCLFAFIFLKESEHFASFRLSVFSPLKAIDPNYRQWLSSHGARDELGAYPCWLWSSCAPAFC